MSALRIAFSQLNLLVGDIAGNVEKMRVAIVRARDELKAQVIIFPELAITGYPPEDLLLRPDFVATVEQGLSDLARGASGIDVIVGHPQRRRDGRLYNAASLLRTGKVEATYTKHCLPNYGVFDEKRYFVPGSGSCVVSLQGIPTAITICEDVWEGWPVDEAAKAGAKLVLNLNASPFHLNKSRERYDVVTRAAKGNGVPILYVNLVGGQDELVFDGESFAVNGDGSLAQRSPAFEEGLYVIDYADGRFKLGSVAPLLSEEQSAYSALVLGVRDYIEKNRFKGAVLGLSGGIDSALTLCIAVDAIGAERVEAVMMPSRYTAAMSLEDAQALAQALNVTYRVIPIEPMFEAFLGALKEEFSAIAPGVALPPPSLESKGLPADTTEENLQARTRGMLLMAISNKTGKIVLTTGNKSEMAVGYATLYGDMAGGFAAIKDVPKTLVYRLTEYRNTVKPVIPRRTIDRPPSAELKPDQKDTDSLPSYDTLDAILERYVERDQHPEDIAAAGFDEATVRRVVAMVDRNEYKRRQAPPGVRITPRAFGRDRRYPITSGFGGRRK
ncbi:MAG: NAD+ synthase [Gammaproteobacteria bacterium]|nr:MAG: NAD+ synthase [Gammaproteobacteria bacterium]